MGSLTLDEWLLRQLELQRDSYHHDPPHLIDAARAEYIRWNVLALVDELHEALGEVSWKPWSKKSQFNRQEYLQELVDAMFFLGNLLLVADPQPGELAALYGKKAEVNRRRQLRGYDESDKCPECRRSFDDVEPITEVTIGAGGIVDVERRCGGCGYVLS